MSIETWFKRIEGGLIKDFESDEQAVLEFLTPIAQQIIAAVNALGKADFASGLQVLKDSVTTAVTAGATAIAAGQNPVPAAETSFLATAAGEGKTALNNAESAAIKAGVAIAQSVVQELNP